MQELNINIDKNNVLPLYYQLKEEIKRMVYTHQLVPGDILPSESELCKTYNLSRGTVRSAMKELSDLGLISKEQGRGTFITIPKLNHDLLGEYSLGRGIKKLGINTHSDVIKCEVVVPKRVSITSRLKLEKRSKVFHLIRVRYADSEPWIYEETFMPAERFPGIENFNYENTLLEDVINDYYHIFLNNIEAYVEPLIVGDSMAAKLRVVSGAPALVMDRVIKDSDGVEIIYSHATVRGDRCRYYFKVNKDFN